MKAYLRKAKVVRKVKVVNHLIKLPIHLLTLIHQVKRNKRNINRNKPKLKIPKLINENILPEEANLSPLRFHITKEKVIIYSINQMSLILKK